MSHELSPTEPSVQVLFPRLTNLGSGYLLFGSGEGVLPHDVSLVQYEIENNHRTVNRENDRKNVPQSIKCLWKSRY